LIYGPEHTTEEDGAMAEGKTMEELRLVEIWQDAYPHTMTAQDFIRIGQRIYGQTDKRWLHKYATELDRKWNTIWCYVKGRRGIPPGIAMKLWRLDRLMDHAGLP
jgi:hypothetical protein